MRVGTGYDVHRLVEGRDLILGGVRIPYEKGLDGHSDADVLLHAIMDALMGAAALGDIGKHFPDTDPAYKGISSVELLKRVGELVAKEMLFVVNIDATVIAQAPKLRPYIDQMEKNVAEALGLEKRQINIKATTEEHLGFTGEGLGISSQAICALTQPEFQTLTELNAPRGCARVRIGNCSLSLTDPGAQDSQASLDQSSPEEYSFNAFPNCAGCPGCRAVKTDKA